MIDNEPKEPDPIVPAITAYNNEDEIVKAQSPEIQVSTEEVIQYFPKKISKHTHTHTNT